MNITLHPGEEWKAHKNHYGRFLVSSQNIPNEIFKLLENNGHNAHIYHSYLNCLYGRFKFFLPALAQESCRKEHNIMTKQYFRNLDAILSLFLSLCVIPGHMREINRQGSWKKQSYVAGQEEWTAQCHSHKHTNSFIWCISVQTDLRIFSYLNVTARK